jgi:hypothetical protein
MVAENAAYTKFRKPSPALPLLPGKRILDAETSPSASVSRNRINGMRGVVVAHAIAHGSRNCSLILHFH